jgi:hypothetical protein
MERVGIFWRGHSERATANPNGRSGSGCYTSTHIHNRGGEGGNRLSRNVATNTRAH